MTKSNRWSKVLGTAGRVISILPDTTEIIGRTIDNTRPIIEKELDRHNDRKNTYSNLDNVIHLEISDAKELLEKRGFIVREILASPHEKYAKTTPYQVINMFPKTKKAKLGSLIKLYYLNDEASSASIILADEKKKKSEKVVQKISDSTSHLKSILKKKTTSRK